MLAIMNAVIRHATGVGTPPAPSRREDFVRFRASSRIEPSDRADNLAETSAAK